MAKYTRSTLTGDNAPVNAELEKIQSAINDQFDRNPTGGVANQLDGDLDANSKRIYNLPAPSNPNDAARLKDVQEAASGSGTVLPDQTGQEGKYLKTDATTAFWGEVSKSSIGLGSVDNTTDLLKPVSTAQQTEINTRALQVDTFANLELLTSTTTGQAFICQERANAFYVLQAVGYTALAGDAVFANGRLAQLQVSGTVKPEFFGFIGDGNTDNSVAFDTLIDRTLGLSHHVSVEWGAGEYEIHSVKTISPTDSSNLSTSVRNITWKGQGGSGLDPATKITFKTPAGTDNLFTMIAVFNAHFKNICFRAGNDCATLIKMTSIASPVFSFHIVKFDGCTFQLNGTATPSDATVVVENGKLARFDSCYFPGGSSNTFKALRAGGDIGDNAGILQQGVMHNFNLTNCFVFGDIDIRNAKQWSIKDSVIDEGGAVFSSGDGRMQSGYIGTTSFLEDDERAAITQGTYNESGTASENAGWLTVENCEFRDRLKSIAVTTGYINITNNEFYVRRSGDIGIDISTTAKNVVIDKLNNFQLAFRNGNVAINDQRLGATGDINIGSDIFVNEWLETNITLNNSGNYENVLQKSTIATRGGNYRFTYSVSILNPNTSQLFKLKIFHTLSSGVSVTLPVQISENITAGETRVISGSFISKLRPDTSASSGSSNVTLQVQAGAVDGATIRGRNSGSLGITFLQVEEI